VPSENIKNKIIEACKNQGLSKEFLFSNDDIFFMSNMDAANYPYYHKGGLNDAAGNYGKSWYQDYLQNTADELDKKNKPTKHFDVHTPVRYNKILFPEIMKRFYTRREMVVKSTYCNALNIPGQYMQDYKIRTFLTEKQLHEFVADKPLFSIGDNCLMDRPSAASPIKKYLETTFPKKSKYEKRKT
jgi:hypothetical protein